MSTRILLLNGPNLNLLGQRDTAMYGAQTLEALNVLWQSTQHRSAPRFSVSKATWKANSSMPCTTRRTPASVCVQPWGYSHTSVALRDAVEAINIPTVEVHLSNIHAREGYRRKSLTAEAAVACISGLGIQGYLAAIDRLLK